MSIVVDHFDGVMQVTLNRPEAANSITVEMALEIAAAIDSFTADDTARVMVVTGAGERSFCAGGDVGSLLEICEHQQADRAGPLGFARLDPGKPTIAAVNGHCYGGGLELSLWCDFRIVAENAVFGALNRPWGVTLIDGGTQRLPRIVGYGNAMWIGLAQEVVPVAQALPRAREIADQLAKLPQSALIADRHGVVASSSYPLEEGLDLETTVGRKVLDDREVVARLSEYRDSRR
jgi:enoyl-CoA hydratase